MAKIKIPDSTSGFEKYRYWGRDITQGNVEVNENDEEVKPVKIF